MYTHIHAHTRTQVWQFSGAPVERTVLLDALEEAMYIRFVADKSVASAAAGFNLEILGCYDQGAPQGRVGAGTGPGSRRARSGLGRDQAAAGPGRGWDGTRQRGRQSGWAGVRPPPPPPPFPPIQPSRILCCSCMGNSCIS